MSNAPITVSGRALPEAVTKNIIRGPIVKPNIDSPISPSIDNTLSLGFNQSVYKVKLVANGRTFNMLLPPSIESKHPGRNNPLQLPGLQIESMSNISKLKIPGFFPIYQHLGVESLYISMSGMFTGYDGEDQISTAGDWEGWANPEVKGGQDAYTAACDLFDFAVKNKALTTVTISTSDGSFEPKKSTSTNFRDERSNIRFKGYIKELKQIYIRQDRVYYMLKFEIIDLGNSKKECTSAKKLIDSKLLADIAARGLNGLNTDNPLTPEDIAFLSPEDLEQSKKVVDLINKKASKEEITKEIDKIKSYAVLLKLSNFAISKNYPIRDYLKEKGRDITKLNIATTNALKDKPKLDDRNKYLIKELINEQSTDCLLTNTCETLNELKKEYIKYLNLYIDDNNKEPVSILDLNRRVPNIVNIDIKPIQDQGDEAFVKYPNAFENKTYLLGAESPQLNGDNLGNKNIIENKNIFNPDKDSYSYLGNNDKGQPLFQIYKDAVILNSSGKRQLAIGRTQNTKIVVVKEIIDQRNTNKENTKYELLPFEPIFN